MIDVDGLVDAGLERLGAGDWHGAANLLRRALQADPARGEAAHGLMRALDQAGRGEEAVEVARGLIAREPDDVLARTGLSMIYQRMGRVDEAEKAGLEAKLLGWKAELRGAGGSEQARAFTGATAVRWFVATTNKGKLRDFDLASDGRVRLEALPGHETIVAPPEDESTFEGNAVIKAVYYSGFAPGEIVVADDSGLEVDALAQRPGVRSARFADDAGFAGVPGATVDARNNHCLIGMMLGAKDRSARYRCSLVAARDGKVVARASGSVEGSILTAPRGTGGFGYDPLFYVDEQGCTMAEMDGGTRLGLSHRGRALRSLLDEAERLASGTR